MSCPLCSGTKVVVDGGNTFPCFGCGPAKVALSPVDTAIYGTTYALVLDRLLCQARNACEVNQELGTKELETMERSATHYAIEAAAQAVQRFHADASSVADDYGGTEIAKLYTIAGGPKHA